MTQEQILEILDSYKLRIPPAVYYDLKADIVNCSEIPNSSEIKWIPITYRTMDEEEKEYYKDTENHRLVVLDELDILDCKLPEDNQEVLITTVTGSVGTDIFCIDDNYCYFDCCDIEDVIAWANFPAPYKRGQGQIKNDN